MLYHVVPPSQVVKTKMSTFALVLVKVGAVPPAHFTAAGHVTARAVPSQVKASVIPNAFPVVGMLEIVSVVIAAFNETANTLPSEQFKVSVPDEIAGAVFVSMSPVMVVKAPQVGADAPLLVNTCPVVPAAVNASSVPLPIAAAPAVGVLLPLIIMLIKSSTFEKCRWLLSLMY